MFNFLKKKLAALKRTAKKELAEDEKGGKSGKAGKGEGKDKGGKTDGAEAHAQKKKVAPGPVRRRRRVAAKTAPESSTPARQGGLSG